MALALKSNLKAQQNRTNLSEINQDENICEFTHTTATLTPTRLKSIEEEFFDRSVNIPPAQFIHEHMAGFRIPSQVNIQSMIKSFSIFTDKSSSFENKSSLLNNFAHYNSSTDSSASVLSSNTSILNPFTDFGLNSSETDNSNSSTHSFMATEPRGGTSANDFPVYSKGVIQIRKIVRRTVKFDKSTDGNSSFTSMKKSNGGGRKPKNDQVSPEEDLKRQKRRERNKIAAARCRKKRVDRTNELEDLKNELNSKHQELSERMRTVMATYCAQEHRFMNHLKGSCKNPDALNSSLPLLTSTDYEQIVNSMYVEWKDEQMNDDVSSSKEGDNPESCQSTVASDFSSSVIVNDKSRNSVDNPHSQSSHQLIPITIIPSSNSKLVHTVPVISTVVDESIASTGSDSSQISAQSKRPNSLVLSAKIHTVTEAEILANNGGIPPSIGSVQTPSTGFLDSLEGSGTGLTPLSVSSPYAFLRSITTPLTDTPEGKTFTSM